MHAALFWLLGPTSREGSPALYDPRYVLHSFDTLAPDAKVAILHAMLDALVLANTLFLLSAPACPGVYQAGLAYQAEEIGHDDWRDIPAVLAHKGGDCEDLACYRVAELRVRHGELGAKPRVTSRQIQSPKYGEFTLYHITVLRGDGVTVEDPSLALGMPA